MPARSKRSKIAHGLLGGDFKFHSRQQFINGDNTDGLPEDALPLASAVFADDGHAHALADARAMDENSDAEEISIDELAERASLSEKNQHERLFGDEYASDYEGLPKGILETILSLPAIKDGDNALRAATRRSKKDAVPAKSEVVLLFLFLFVCILFVYFAALPYSAFPEKRGLGKGKRFVIQETYQLLNKILWQLPYIKIPFGAKNCVCLFQKIGSSPTGNRTRTPALKGPYPNR
jgi:hypothetical protein